MSVTKLSMNGALGRMGRRILTLAAQSEDFKITGAFEYAKHPDMGKDLGSALGLGSDLKVRVAPLDRKGVSASRVLIDFSSPEAAMDALAHCVAAGSGIVIGTTGLRPEQEKVIRKAADKIPVLHSPNMSLGANFLFELARLAAGKLGEGYDIEIIESHHRLKKDAPSGTARKIAEVIADEKGWDLAKAARYGRQGITGERTKNEIGIHVVRAGDIVGEHTVIFGGPGETIELKHVALSRDAFARGALVAARFLAGKTKGLYQMTDVLK